MKRLKRSAYDAKCPKVASCEINVRKVWEISEIKRSLYSAFSLCDDASKAKKKSPDAAKV